MGIDEHYRFRVHERPDLSRGQVIVLSTDGVWEARNSDGELFGKDRFYKLIRANADQNASSILNRVIGTIDQFQAGAKIEDDITMVVVKIEKDL